MIKVCHMTSAHSSDDVRIFHKQCVSLAKAGYDTYLIAKGESREDHGVHVIGVSLPKRGRVLRMVHFSKEVYRIALSLDADVYHLHDPELLPYGLKLCKKGKKVIYDIHEYYREVIPTKEYLPKILRKPIAEIVWMLEKKAARRMACCIAATEQLSRIYAPYAKRCEYILNFDFRNGESIDYSAARDIDVIHVGTLSQKRLAFLVSIAELLPAMKFCFVGVNDTLIRYMEATHKATANIMCVPRVPFEEIKSYYQRSKIGVSYHPPEKRFLVAIPMKIFEYMKYGLPVIISDLPPMRRYVLNNENGLVIDTNTPEAFANAIISLIQSPELGDISARNQLAINDKYNWETESIKLIKIYQDLGD